MFDASSRYYNLPIQTENLANGKHIAFTGRRFLPSTAQSSMAGTVQVTASDRLDTLAANLLGDPLLFWKICDANTIMNPLTILEPGMRLVIAGG